MQNAELLDRIATLEARVAALEARPQPAQPVSGTVMHNWPWPTATPATVGEIMAGQMYTASVRGAAGGPATPAGMNGEAK